MPKPDIEVVYDKRRSLDLTKVIRYTDGSAKIIIGTRGATRKQIADTLRHEKSHLAERYKKGTKIWQTVYKRVLAELRAYDREKKRLSARAWNRILNTRREDFMSYYNRLSSSHKRAIKPRALRVLKKRAL